ncbi:hypothetical protein RB195_016530 [Necator americanus]|uniref:Secreted protein n=1 Tax=Necator americanus TaxID=51031 RepID=A0ABR1C239_NECAM
MVMIITAATGFRSFLLDCAVQVPDCILQQWWILFRIHHFWNKSMSASFLSYDIHVGGSEQRNDCGVQNYSKPVHPLFFKKVFLHSPMVST